MNSREEAENHDVERICEYSRPMPKPMFQSADTYLFQVIITIEAAKTEDEVLGNVTYGCRASEERKADARGNEMTAWSSFSLR